MGLLLVVFWDKHLNAIKDEPSAWMKLVVYSLPRPYDGHWSLGDEETWGNRELHCEFLPGTPEQAIHIPTLHLQVYI
jgi:hypothetical protein